MKKKSILIYFVVLHALLGLILWDSNFIAKTSTRLGLRAQPELTDHYHHMVAFHREGDDQVPQGATIFIGDSLTQSLYVGAITRPSVNYGIGNDTTTGVLKRIPHYRSLERAEKIVLAIGINDMRYRPNEDLLENYRAILSALPAETPIFINSILPVSRDGIIEATRVRIESLNDQLKKIAEAETRLTFVSPNSALSDEKGLLLDQYHKGDGVHLNHLGNTVWMATLKDALKTTSSETQ